MKASKLAARMATVANRDGIGKGAGGVAVVSDYLPYAQGLVDAFAPVEKSLKKILKGNQRRLDEMNSQLSAAQKLWESETAVQRTNSNGHHKVDADAPFWRPLNESTQN